VITAGLLISGACAATMTSAQTCAALQKQWDSIVTTKASTANAASARKLATTAAADCKAGKPKTPVADYRKALQAVGEKPKY
jgi:hypothetical protein